MKQLVGFRAAVDVRIAYILHIRQHLFSNLQSGYSILHDLKSQERSFR